MVLTLDPKLDLALTEAARRQGLAPEALALEVLKERFNPVPSLEPQDEWERKLLDAAIRCGVSPPAEALTREGLYEV